MCGGGGGGGGGPSWSQQKKFQKKIIKKQNQLTRKANRQAKKQHKDNMAFNTAQFEASRQDSWDQFFLGQQQQAEFAMMQMASQEAQFAAAQEAQQYQLEMQLKQNEEMARQSEIAANRAMGMRLIGDAGDAPKIKSKARGSKARKRATQGTAQLSNPLTISMGGGSSNG